MKRGVLVVSMLVLLAAAIVFTQSTKAYAADSGSQYTSYNLWYETSDRLWSINYKKGEIIPAGTEVDGVDVGRKTVEFRTKKDNRNYTIHFNPKHHAGVTIREFAQRLFTDKSFESLVSGLTKKEITGIKEGAVTAGMSKKAVLISYGYPPEHANSTDDKEWTYWYDMFRKTIVYFDDKGFVTKATR